MRNGVAKGGWWHDMFMCSVVQHIGWYRIHAYTSYTTITLKGKKIVDKDNADLWVDDEGNCMLVFAGSDEETEIALMGDSWAFEKQYGTSFYKSIFGVQASSFVSTELQGLLSAMQKTHGSLKNMFKRCTSLTVVGHSLGGGQTELFSYLANRKDDPLKVEKRVDYVYTFAPVPAGKFVLPNGQAADGCFKGMNYFSVLPKGWSSRPGDEVDIGMTGYMMSEGTQHVKIRNTPLKFMSQFTSHQTCTNYKPDPPSECGVMPDVVISNIHNPALVKDAAGKVPEMHPVHSYSPFFGPPYSPYGAP
jgi:hypothetical protein